MVKNNVIARQAQTSIVLRSPSDSERRKASAFNTDLDTSPQVIGDAPFGSPQLMRLDAILWI